MTSNPENGSAPKRATVVWAVAVGLLAFLTHSSALGNGFTLDDLDAVQNDTRLRTSSFGELLVQPYLWNVPPARSPYRPVTTLSYALDWKLGGGQPAVFHLFNLLAHVAASLLVLALLRRLGAGGAVAGISALVFAVHPVHTEAVANVVGRADVLMTVFCLVGLLVHLSPKLTAPVRGACVCVAYLLAVGAKENGYILPALIVLVEAIRGTGGGSSLAESWRETGRRMVATWPLMIAMGATLGAYLVLRTSVLGSVAHLDVAAYMAVLPTHLRVTTAVANLAEVARLLVFPYDLSWHYGPDVIEPTGPTQLRFWLGVAVVGAVTTLAWRAWSDRTSGRWTLGAVGWIAATFALLSNLIIPMPMWLAERTLYLPSVGVALGCAAGLEAARLLAAPRRRVVATVAAIVLALGVARSWSYAKVWRSTETLFTDLVERHPESFHAPWWIGARLVEAGEVERGLGWLERATAQNPNGVMVRLDYARALLLAGRADEAEAQMVPVPRGLHPSVSVFLAQSLIMQGRVDEARAVVEDGLAHFPDEPRLIEQRRQLAEQGRG